MVFNCVNIFYFVFNLLHFYLFLVSHFLLTVTQRENNTRNGLESVTPLIDKKLRGRKDTEEHQIGGSIV